MTSKTKKILIIPGMNQSQELYSFFHNTAHFFKFPCNDNDLHALKNTRIDEYVEMLIQHLSENKYDFVLAHSLGGLVFSLAITRNKGLGDSFNKAILIAPAYSSKFFASIFSILPDHFKIPSFNFKKYRVNSFCFAFMYKEIAFLQNELKHELIMRDSKISIYYDPRDELIETSLFEDFRNAKIFYSKIYPRHLYLDLIKKVAEGHRLF